MRFESIPAGETRQLNGPWFGVRVLIVGDGCSMTIDRVSLPVPACLPGLAFPDRAAADQLIATGPITFVLAESPGEDIAKATASPAPPVGGGAVTPHINETLLQSWPSGTNFSAAGALALYKRTPDPAAKWSEILARSNATFGNNLACEGRLRAMAGESVLLGAVTYAVTSTLPSRLNLAGGDGTAPGLRSLVAVGSYPYNNAANGSTIMVCTSAPPWVHQIEVRLTVQSTFVSDGAIDIIFREGFY